MASEFVVTGIVETWRGRTLTRTGEESWSFAPGTLTVVVGANGSGKSTLLRTLSGAIRPSSGLVEGRGTVGFVPEKLVLPARLVAAGYLRHMGAVRGVPSHLRMVRAIRLTDALGLEPGPRARLGSLSKGNLQKIAIAQAFLAPVDVLLLDEPRSGLDGPANAALDDLVESAVLAGSIVIVTAHHARTFARADRVLELDESGLRDRTADRRPATPVFAVTAVRASAAPETGSLDSFIVSDRSGKVLAHVPEPQLGGWLTEAVRCEWKIIELRPLRPEEHQ